MDGWEGWMDGGQDGARGQASSSTLPYHVLLPSIRLSACLRHQLLNLEETPARPGVQRSGLAGGTHDV